MKPIFESAATALNLGMLKHGKVVNINHLCVSLAHAHASVLQATARQHGFRLNEEPVSCSTCSRVKGNRAPTAYHTTARDKRPMELVHIDTTGPFPASHGGSLYVVIFCGQRLSPPASLQHPRQECGRHPRRREAFHCRHGSSTSFPE